MPLFPDDFPEDTIFLSRSDPDSKLGTFSEAAFFLENKEWPTVEHYYQAMKFKDEAIQETIRQAESAKKARKYGRKKHESFRKDWKKVRETMMTRGIYIRCKTYPDFENHLLETDNRQLIENSLYDYFWGCGRDRRGENAYGKVLMKVRDKLDAERKQKDTP